MLTDPFGTTQITGAIIGCALPVGLLINFNVELLARGGVKRVVNSRYRAGAGTTVPIVGSQDPPIDREDLNELR